MSRIRKSNKPRVNNPRKLALEPLHARHLMAGDFIEASAVGTTDGGESFTDVVYQNGARYEALRFRNFSNTFDLDPQHVYADNRDLIASSASSNLQTTEESVIAKFDSNGLLQWRTAVLGTVLDIEVSGNAVYVAGYTAGDGLTFGSTTISTGQNADTLLIKLQESDGSWSFVKQIATPTTDERWTKLSVSPDGTTAYVFSLWTSTTYNSTLTSFNIQGSAPATNWTRNWVGQSITIMAIKNLSNSQIVLGGLHRGESDFDPNSTVTKLQSGPNKTATNPAGFVMVLSSSGSLVWAKNFQSGKVGGSRVTSLAVDSSGIALAGNWNGAVDFDPGTGVRQLVNLGGDDAFFVRLNTSGSLLQASNFGTSNTESNVLLVGLPTGGYVLSVRTPAYTQLRRLSAQGVELWNSKAEAMNVVALAFDAALGELHALGDVSGDMYYTDSTGVRPATPQLRSYSSIAANASRLRIRLN